MTGELIYGDGGKPRPYLLLPPEQAAIEALSAYLKTQAFLVHAGAPEVDELSRVRAVSLAYVLEDFPGPGNTLQYPCASLIPVGEIEHEGGFTPSAIPVSFDPVAKTALWDLGQARGLLQLDLFADSKAVRDALVAALPALFNPNEGMSGLYLRGAPAYACATLRYLLLSHSGRDTLEGAYANERRVSASIRFEAPLLGLRCALPLNLQRPTEVT